MRYKIKDTYPNKNQVSVFNADTGECYTTGALESVQKFIFFHSYVRGLAFNSFEYRQANLQAHRDWFDQRHYFCSQATLGSTIEL